MSLVHFMYFLVSIVISASFGLVAGAFAETFFHNNTFSMWLYEHQKGMAVLVVFTVSLVEFGLLKRLTGFKFAQGAK